MKNLVPILRLLLGLIMLASGIDHFVVHFIPVPPPTDPLAAQLMDALVHSGLIDVVKAVQLAVGVALLGDLFVPLVLCLLMPLSVCAAYWAVVLEGQLFGMATSLLALALNGLLMLAYFEYYRGALHRRATTLAESEAENASYDSLLTDPGGRAPQGAYAGALVTLLAAVGLYYVLVPSANGVYAMVALLFPAWALHARRLHDMGQSALLLLVPLALILAIAWLRLTDPEVSRTHPAILAALVVSAGFVLWSLLGKGKAAAG